MKTWLKLIFLMSFSTCSLGNELTHHFANPDFIGGNPNDGVVFLNEANAQNSFKAPIVPAAPKPTALENLATRIQSALITMVASADSIALKNALINPKTGYINTGTSLPISGGYTVSTSVPDGITGSVAITISDAAGNFTTLTMPDASTK